MNPTIWNNTAKARGRKQHRRATRIERMEYELVQANQLLRQAAVYLVAFEQVLNEYAKDENWLLKDFGKDILWNGEAKEPARLAKDVLIKWRSRYGTKTGNGAEVCEEPAKAYSERVGVAEETSTTQLEQESEEQDAKGEIGC